MWQLEETGPHTYSIVWLYLAHEAMDMQALMQQRIDRALKPKTTGS